MLPEPLREIARRHPLLRALYVTDAGYFPDASGHRVARKEGAPTTLVILCRRGRGWFKLAGERSEVRAGDLVWLPARQAHAYGADEADPWTIAWAHFSGEEVAGWRELLFSFATASEPRLALPADRMDEIALDQVHGPLERGHALRHQVAAAAALRGALSQMIELLVEHRASRSAGERVAASIDRLRRDWIRPHRLAELATDAGMSVTHYSAHFRRLTGFAPIDFLIRQRVRHACRLLDTTRLPIAEVAAGVGYEDPYYFTRCFRRVMGCPPQNYRTVQKG